MQWDGCMEVGEEESSLQIWQWAAEGSATLINIDGSRSLSVCRPATVMR